MKSTFLRRMVFVAMFTALLSTLLIGLNADDLDVKAYSEPNSDDNLVLEFTSDTNMYFQFWGTSSLSTGQWDTVRGISLGASGRQCWVDKQVLRDYESYFYRIKPVSLTAPEDLDADGIDDVFELRHVYLNPLLASDALRDFDQDGADNVTEYRHSTDLMNEDTDGDQMPDVWEIDYHYGVSAPTLQGLFLMSDNLTLDGLDPLDGSDDMEDPDGDGYANIYEFMHGSDPLVPASYPASTVFVAPGAVGGDGTQGSPFGTIQEALNAASSYAIIELADGVYSGIGNRGLSYLGKPVMVMSTNGAEACVIDCENRDRGFAFFNSESIRSVLCGVTIRNGFSWSGNGGGIFCFDASPFIQRCIIERCDAVCGGGISCAYGSPFIYHCVLADNDVYTYGGGIFAEQYSFPRIQNCTITGNGTWHDGGGVYSTVLSAPLVRNSIVWGNTPDALNGASLVAEYSFVEGGASGTGNSAADPQLAKGISRLTASSPCIDAGIETNMIAMDLDAETTYDDPGHVNVISAVDVGADEFVDVDGDNMADSWEIRFFGDLSHNGSADGDAGGADGLTDLQEYLENCNPTVRDTDGDGLTDGAEVNTHLTSPRLADSDEDLMEDGWELTYGFDPRVADMAEISGDLDDDGFLNVYEAVHGTLPDDAASVPQATLFVDAAAGGGDGSRSNPFSRIADAIDVAYDLDIIELSAGVYLGTGNTSLSTLGKPIMITGTNGGVCAVDGEDSARAFNLARGEDRRTVVHNITIQNCRGQSNGTFGGGMLCSNSSPSVIGCLFTSNTMANGAGIAVFNGAPNVKDCVFSNNAGASYGALYFKLADEAVVDGCTISGGREYYAALCYFNSTNFVIRDTLLYDNNLAIRTDYSRGVMEGCTVVDNSSYGVRTYYAALDIRQSTFAGNELGLYVYYSSDVTLTNCIIWGNAEAYTNRADLAIDYSCVQEGFAGTGNISVDPQFTMYGYRLRATSPCIDAGAATSVADRDGEAVWDDPAHANVVSSADMGSDEFVDTDADGMADVWELAYAGNLSMTAATDADAQGGADGLTALQEYNSGTSPNHADTDGDGLNDAEEVLTYGSNPLSVDTDEDGIDDAWEAVHELGLLVPNAMEDSDNDRYPNYYEFVNDTDPTNSASVPTANLYVNAAAGYDSPAYGSSTWPVKTIGYAVERAVEDSIIMVADGIYDELEDRNIRPAGKRVLVISENGAEHAVIDARQLDRAFYFSAAETEKTVISGLTIKNGVTTGYGGAMYIQTAAPTIIDCVMVSNAAISGGAISCYEGRPVLRNCVFAHNSVANQGGASWSRGVPRMINCVVNNNRAGEAGACYIYSGTGVFENCTIVHNAATNEVGGIKASYSGKPIIRNSVLWGHGGDELVALSSQNPPEVSYTCIKDGYAGTGNITNNPMLTPYTYQLTQNSPCIDAGEDSGILYDHNRHSRYDVSSVPNTVSAYDMGAFEFIDSDNDGMPDWWELEHFGNLAQNGTLDNDAAGGADGLTDLQEYLYGTDPEVADTDGDTLSDGAEVLTHLTHPVMADTDGDFTEDGWEVAYGFDPLDDYDGSVDHDGDRFDNIYEHHHNTNPTNAMDYPAATIFVDASVSGIGSGTVGSPFRSIQRAISNAAPYDIIQLADGRYPGSVDVDINLSGRAVMIVSESGADTCFVDLEYRGQGFLIQEGEDLRTVICDLTICNASAYGGGAFDILRSYPQIRSCNIYSNQASLGGAAIEMNRSQAIIRDCHILANSGGYGSAIRIGSWMSEFQSDPLLENNRITGNRTDREGIICIERVAPRFVNNTICDNVPALGSTNVMVTMWCEYSGAPEIVNSILWNEGSEEIFVTNSSVPSVEYSCVRNGYAGDGNIALDPKVSPVSGRLQADSPCIDAGCVVSRVTDFEHDARWDHPSVANAVSAVDMGADEFIDSDSDTLADSWEMKYLGNLSQNASNDGDGDTLNNGQEYLLATNPDAADTDSDLLRDDVEISTYGTLPQNSDTDGDCVGDGWEVQYGFLPLDAEDGMDDPDLDRYPNLYEFIHGSVPTNVVSVPAPTVYVDASAPAGGDGSQSSPFRRIQDVAASSETYDVVRISTGRYLTETGAAYFYNPILLVSEFGPTGTVVDCNGRGGVMFFKDAPGLRSCMSGITFANISNEYSSCLEVSRTGLVVDDCRFVDNQSTFSSAIDSSESKLVVRNSRFAGNSSLVGGVVDFNYCHGSRIENSVIANNLVQSGTAVDVANSGDVVLDQVTVVYNFCAGIRVRYNSQVALSNCIVWGSYQQEFLVTNSTVDVNYSCVEGGYAGTGNSSVNPQVAPYSGNLHHDSPCIDSGATGLAVDMDGEVAWDDPDHVNGITVRDMGADEFVDTDSDNMGDAWELLYFGDLSHTGGGDGDSDGASDLQEYEAGTDPTQG